VELISEAVDCPAAAEARVAALIGAQFADEKAFQDRLLRLLRDLFELPNSEVTSLRAEVKPVDLGLDHVPISDDSRTDIVLWHERSLTTCIELKDRNKAFGELYDGYVDLENRHGAVAQLLAYVLCMVAPTRMARLGCGEPIEAAVLTCNPKDGYPVVLWVTCCPPVHAGMSWRCSGKWVKRVGQWQEISASIVLHVLTKGLSVAGDSPGASSVPCVGPLQGCKLVATPVSDAIIKHDIRAHQGEFFTVTDADEFKKWLINPRRSLSYGSAAAVEKGQLVKVSGPAFPWINNAAELDSALRQLKELPVENPCRVMADKVLVAARRVSPRGFVTVMNNLHESEAVTWQYLDEHWREFEEDVVNGVLWQLANIGLRYADLRPGLSNVRVDNEKFVVLDWESLMTGGTFSRDGRYPRAGLSEDDEVRGQVLLIRFAVHRAKSLTKSLGEVEREMLKPKQLREFVEWTHNHGEAAIEGKSRCTAMRAAHVPIV